MIPPEISFVGSGSIDYYLAAAKVIVSDQRSFKVQCSGGVFAFQTCEPIEPGAKISVTELPAAMLADAPESIPGGGALNSLAAYLGIVPRARCRYLDACKHHNLLADCCAAWGTDARFMGLCPVPHSAVVEMWSRDKLLLKTQQPLLIDHSNGGSRDDLRWIAESDALVMNSARPIGLVSQLVNLQAEAGFRLHVAMTRSLPKWFVARTVFPSATTIFANWDEVRTLTGFPVERSVQSAIKALSWLRQFSPRAVVFLTLGSRGVLVSPAGSHIVFHVCLQPEAASTVWAHVAARPSRVCGCGDSFFGGAVAAIETGQSLLSGHNSECEPAVSFAMSGCAAAVHRLGYSPALPPEAFRVREVVK